MKQKKVVMACGHRYGGILNTVAALYSELKSQYCVHLFGPQTLFERLNIKRRAPRQIFNVCEPSWGLNQWKFFFETSLRYVLPLLRKHYVLHAHHPVFIRPDIYTAHGIYIRSWLGKPKPGFFAKLQFKALSWAEKRTLRAARHVVYPSLEVQRYVENELGIVSSQASTHVIPSGCDLSMWRPLPREHRSADRKRLFPEFRAESVDARWLLFVGNDFEGKGLLRLLRALLQQAATNKPYQVLVVGHDDAQTPAFEALRKQLQPGTVVRLSEDRLKEAYQLSDFLVMDSVSEGFPLVLLEAMASGCVPLVTAFGGALECVGDGIAGRILPNAEAIVATALTMPCDELQSHAAAAPQKAAQFSWAHVARAYAALYQTFN